MLELKANQLQAAADSAAMGGMLELGRKNPAWSQAALTEASAAGFTNGQNNTTITVQNPPTSGSYKNDTLAVQVTASVTVDTILRALLSTGLSTISVNSVARLLPTCAYIMRPTDGAGPIETIKLSSSNLRGNGCGLYVNSTGHTDLIDYFAVLATNRNRAVGPASLDSSSSYRLTPAFRHGVLPVPDPLGYLAAPTYSGTCTYTNASYTDQTVTLSPGVYCGGLQIHGGVTTFLPGLYVIMGGMGWNPSSTTSPTINGSGVTFYMTKGSAASYGQLTINGTNNARAVVNLSAPNDNTTGAVPGVLFFLDRNWVATGNQDLVFGLVDIYADGVWYAIKAGMYLYSTGFYKQSRYNCLVLDNLYEELVDNVILNADFSMVTTADGSALLHYPDGLLVQ